MKSKPENRRSTVLAGSTASTSVSGNASRYWLAVLVLLAVGLSFASLLNPAPRVVQAQSKQPKVTPDGQAQETGGHQFLVSQPMAESARQQIESLLREKETRTPAQQKIDSNLLYTVKQSQGLRIAEGVGQLETGIVPDSQGKVVVDCTAFVSDAFVTRLKELGCDLQFVSQELRSIRAAMPLAQLETIAALPEVIFLQPQQGFLLHREPSPAITGPDLIAGPPSLPALPQVNPSLVPHLNAGFAGRAERIRSQLRQVLGTQTQPDGQARLQVHPEIVNVSQGDKTHKADLARTMFGVNGSGVKVGVLSDGVDSLATLQASGDLPANVTVLSGQAGSGNEGAAMLEIVYDLAPGAQLYFATGITGGLAQFATNIRALQTAGCNVIVDDIGYFVETPFQTGQAPSVVSNTNGGLVTQAVNDVVAAGVAYFSSAANSGNKNDNQSGTWEGNFVDGGPTAAPIPAGSAGRFLDFDGVNGAPLVTQNDITVSGGAGTLFWSDPLGGSANDYDLFRLTADGTAVQQSSTNIQSGTQDPFEQISSTSNINPHLVVVKKTGAADRYLHLDTNRGRLTISTSGSTHGHSCAPNGFGVAATPAGPAKFGTSDPPGPFPNPFNAANVVETFSSDGLRQTFFNPDSTPITPGNFLAGGGAILQKPDLTAADGVSCASPGFDPFFGTSAAAPHAAAIAALVKSANPGLTVSQIRTALQNSAVDIEAPGVDRDSGFGIIRAFEAVQSVATPTPILSAGATSITAGTCGSPATGAIDPGETVTVSLTLQNQGTAATNGTVRATLNQALSTNVTAVTGTNPQIYPQIGTGSAQTQSFSFTAGGTCGQNVVVRLDLADGGPTFTNSLGFVTFSFLLGTASTQTFGPFANSTGITIPNVGNATPYPSSVTVSGVTSPVTKVTVNLNGLSHGFASDLDILLVGPAGQSCILMSDAGGSSVLTNLNLVFDDNATGTIPTTNPASGTYRPTNVATPDSFPSPGPGNITQANPTLTVFAGLSGSNVNGTWNLFVVDDGDPDGGTITSWSLTIQSTGTVCSNCACPTITVSPGTLPNATNGTGYNQTVTASGGTAPYTFALTSGTLPVGLSLSSGGAITGTPTTNGTSNFTVTATATGGCFGSQSYSITVSAATSHTVTQFYPVASTSGKTI
ncbi:MAG: putative Ig domain-containing protein, partial [Blastocatellia bacterium]|nr:putative Ig domain-containing protein [Blastocatellia bacterium]